MSVSYKNLKIKRNRRCQDCGILIARFGALRCRKCAKQGVLHSGYKDGRSITPKFCKCGTQIKWQNKICNPCYNKVKSERMKKKWSNPEYKTRVVRKWRQNCSISPNTKEVLISSLLHTLYPKEYKFVGDGSFMIEGYNPDFINCNGQKKIIEFFGDYWHDQKEYVKRDKLKMKVYKKYGYKTLVIWQSELNDMKKVTNRIKKFHEVSQCL